MRRFKLLFLLLSTMLMLSTCATPALAFADDPEQEPAAGSTEPVTGGVEPAPLTPEGNMTLVDDIDGEAGTDKRFIVVQSCAGHYFYIIVDRAAEGENTVHFLNQVDEADLLSLIEQEEQAPAVCSCTTKCMAGMVNTSCEVCAVNMSECVGTEPEPEEPDTPPVEPDTPEKPEKKGGNPLERMMMRPPVVRRKPDPAPPVPQSHPCYGCKRRNEGSCVLLCTGAWRACPCGDGRRIILLQAWDNCGMIEPRKELVLCRVLFQSVI